MNTYEIYRVPYGHLIELRRNNTNIVYSLAVTAALIASLCILFYLTLSVAFCAYNASLGCILFCIAMLRTAYLIVRFYMWTLFGSESILIANNQITHTKNYRWFTKVARNNFSGISTQTITNANENGVKSARLTFKTDTGVVATKVSLPRPQADKIAKRINAYHYAA